MLEEEPRQTPTDPIVIHIPDPPPDPTAAPDVAAVLAGHQRDVGVLLEAVRCPVRLQLFVRVAAGEDMHVTALAEQTGHPHDTVSSHLNTLRKLGFVDAVRKGKYVYYQLAPHIARIDQHPDRVAVTLKRPGGAFVTIGGPVRSDL